MQLPKIVVYFTPVFMLTALLLLLLGYLAPTVTLAGKVALLTVTASGDGAAVYTGLLGE